MTKSATKPNSKDAVSLLTHDHKEVKSLFKKFESLGDRAFVAKKALAGEICQALLAHATIEENIFYPAVKKHLKDSSDMVSEALVEHASAKGLITQILIMSPEDTLFDAALKVLSEHIDHHVGEEEEMFVKVRKSNMDLVALGEEMSAYQPQPDAAVPAVTASWPYGSAQESPSATHLAR